MTQTITKHWCSLCIFLFFLLPSLHAQNVNIPAEYFKRYLINDTNVDTNNDGEVQLQEAQNYTGPININGIDIGNIFLADLTGIEAFTNITDFSLAHCTISSLDLSACTSLNSIFIYANRVSIDLTLGQLPNLTSLRLEHNGFSSPLNLSNYTDLTSLTIYSGNDNITLPASNNNLEQLDLQLRSLSTIDLSIYPSLTHLTLEDMEEITQLDLTQNNTLESVNIKLNLLSGFSLPTNPQLTRLSITSYKLTALDLSNCHQLTYLNSEYCNKMTQLTLSPTANFEYFNCHNNQLSSIDLSNSSNLEVLLCGNNQLTTLILPTQRQNLTRLDCSHNLLTSVDIAQSPALQELDIAWNDLPSINIDQCINLETFNCHHNDLASLDISTCTGLTYLNCNHNLLQQLDINTAPLLNYVNCSYNILTHVPFTVAFPLLAHVDISYNRLNSLQLSSTPSLRTLNCSYNQITLNQFNIGANLPNLRVLNISHNQITALPFSATFSMLSTLDCSYNSITIISPQFFQLTPKLNTLKCNDNELKELDITASIYLSTLDCSNNKLTLLDISNSFNLRVLNCSNNNLDKLEPTDFPSFRELYCANNPIGNFSYNFEWKLKSTLEIIDFSATNITRFAMNEPSRLHTVICNNTKLRTLEIRGMDKRVPTRLISNNNPDLDCIAVDDLIYANEHWTNSLDSHTGFAYDCTLSELCHAFAAPNPAFNSTRIHWINHYPDLTITVYNPLGQSTVVPITHQHNYVDINLDGGQGVYFVHLSTPNESHAVKIIKQ